MCLSIGYPPPEYERKLLINHSERKKINDFSPIINTQQLSMHQLRVSEINVASPILDYVQAILFASRNSGNFIHGLSPRTGKAIINSAQAKAYLSSRDFVMAEDIQAVLPSVINHRLVFFQSDELIQPSQQILSQVEVPV